MGCGKATGLAEISNQDSFATLLVDAVITFK
jgi:hypothetical protein